MPVFTLAVAGLLVADVADTPVRAEASFRPGAEINAFVFLDGFDEDEIDTIQELVWPVRSAKGFTGKDADRLERMHPGYRVRAVIKLADGRYGCELQPE